MSLDTFEAEGSRSRDVVFELLSTESTALDVFYAKMREKRYLSGLIMSHVQTHYGTWMGIINLLHGALLFMDALMDFHGR